MVLRWKQPRLGRRTPLCWYCWHASHDPHNPHDPCLAHCRGTPVSAEATKCLALLFRRVFFWLPTFFSFPNTFVCVTFGQTNESLWWPLWWSLWWPWLTVVQGGVKSEMYRSCLRDETIRVCSIATILSFCCGNTNDFASHETFAIFRFQHLVLHCPSGCHCVVLVSSVPLVHHHHRCYHVPSLLHSSSSHAFFDF